MTAMNALAHSSHDGSPCAARTGRLSRTGGGSRAQTGPSSGLQGVARQRMRGMTLHPSAALSLDRLPWQRNYARR
ncbi:hypothetical protein BN1263420006 [Stenotrophomonas indicatrix]|nr:hypothetical protein BN1263420006 [Stenotrophomonas indicatrix]